MLNLSPPQLLRLSRYREYGCSHEGATRTAHGTHTHRATTMAVPSKSITDIVQLQLCNSSNMEGRGWLARPTPSCVQCVQMEHYPRTIIWTHMVKNVRVNFKLKQECPHHLIMPRGGRKQQWAKSILLRMNKVG